MNKKFMKLRGLFSNTKFLIVFSIAVAIIFWVVVALEFSPIVDETIRDVPVSVNLDSDALNRYGLQGFGADNFKVDIIVEGKRYVVGVLDASDFDVTADTAYVDTAGKYSLQIKAVPKDSNADYGVIDLSSDYIEVYFDKLLTDVSVPIEPRIVRSPQKMTEDGLSFDVEDIILSQQTVTISGAKAEVEKIKKVYADIDIDKTMSVSTSVDAVLSFEEPVKYVEYKDAVKSSNGDYIVPAHLCIYKDETVRTGVDFVNAPSEAVAASMKYKMNYDELTFEVLQSKDGVELPQTISVGAIDFSKLSPSENVFRFDADDMKEYISENKTVDGGIKYSGSVNSFTVTVDTSGLGSTQLNLPEKSIKFSDGKSYKIDASSLKKITVVGAKNQLSKISAANLEATVNLDGITLNKSEQEVPVTVKIKNNDTCWVYGEYFIRISA